MFPTQFSRRFLKNLLFILSLVLFSCAGARADNPTNATTSNVSPPGNPTLVPSSRTDTNWSLIFQRHLDRIKQGSIDLLFFGDSITGCFFEQGMKDWNARYGSLNAAAFGIAGDRIEHVLWRVENGELKGISPKLIVLLIGTNNLGQAPPNQIAEGIGNLVHEIEKRSPSSHILLLGIFPRSKKADDPIRTLIKDINGRISGLGDGKQVTYLDIGSKFLEANGDMLEGITFDYLHPNAAGCHIWYDAIQPIIDTYFPPAVKSP